MSSNLTVAKSFAPATIGVNDPSVLTITFTNPNATDVTGIAFTDAYPGGLVNTATPAGATTCAAGSVTAVAGGSSVAFSGGTVTFGTSCTVMVNVTSAVAGSYLNNTGNITTTNAGTIAGASATLTVLAHPTVAKAFAPNPTGINAPSVLTITLGNTNAVAVTGVAFTDTYPAGLVNTGTPAGATTCGAARYGG